MSQTIVCSFCEKEFTPSVDDGGMWLICPHCGGRTPNPWALDRRITKGRPLASFGVLGGLLLIFAGLGTLVTACGGFCLFPRGLAPNGSPIFLALLGFSAAVFASFKLMRLGRKSHLNEGEIVGRTLLLAALFFLAALGGIIFALATCFGGHF